MVFVFQDAPSDFAGRLVEILSCHMPHMQHVNLRTANREYQSM